MPLTRTFRRAAGAAAICGALLLAACSSGDARGSASTTEAPRPADVGAVLEGLASDVIVPSYEALGSSLATLDSTTAELCAAPSEGALDAARSAWGDAVAAWQQTRATGVGPALDERLMSDVGFAARPSVIVPLLAGDDPVDVEAMADEGAAARGLYAAEEALFGDGSEALTSSAGARRCEYAASIATLMVGDARPVIDAWTDGDAGQQLVAGLDGGPQSSVDALVNEGTHRLEEIDGMGLRDLAAARSIDDLDEARAGGAADQRLADRRALLAGVSSLIGDGSTGISALVAAEDPDTADRLVAAQARADAAMAALPGSVTAAFDDLEAVAAASEAIADLKVLLSTEVATKLGVTITFSDSDGDG
jgi:predicted lipoprotein